MKGFKQKLKPYSGLKGALTIKKREGFSLRTTAVILLTPPLEKKVKMKHS